MLSPSHKILKILPQGEALSDWDKDVQLLQIVLKGLHQL